MQIVVLAKEVWRGVSARSSFAGEPPAEDKGLNRVTAGLTFTRWDSSRPADVDNLILLTFEEARSFRRSIPVLLSRGIHADAGV